MRPTTGTWSSVQDPLRCATCDSPFPKTKDRDAGIAQALSELDRRMHAISITSGGQASSGANGNKRKADWDLVDDDDDDEARARGINILGKRLEASDKYIAYPDGEAPQTHIVQSPRLPPADPNSPSSTPRLGPTDTPDSAESSPLLVGQGRWARRQRPGQKSRRLE